MQEIAAFLDILFPLFIKSIEFHGLPNNFLAGSGGGEGGVRSSSPVDCQIGSLCAQALLHFMKTSQAAFKAAMLNQQNKKSVIESAVRGEMSGYSGGGGGAGGGGAGSKPKKLSLSNFG